jgi:hypothetical protein
MTIRSISFLCALCAFGFYLFTLAPTFGWGDNADLALRMVYAGDRSFVGTSRDYIFYRGVGSLFQLIPIGDAGTRANIMTAFFGAVTIGLVAFISGMITQQLFASAAAAVALMVSHTFWLMSVLAEVYTFNTALVFACYACVTLWWQREKMEYLVVAALFAGLTLLHHAMGLVLGATLVPLIFMRIRKVPIAGLIIVALVFIAASFPYWQQSISRLFAGQPFLRAMGLQNPSNGFFDVSPLREFGKFIAYASYNFLGIGFVLAGSGIFIAWQKKYWEMAPLIIWLLLFIFVGITASIPDKFNIYVLVYPVLAVSIGVGAASLHKKYLPVVLVLLGLLPPVGYIAAIETTKYLGVDVVGARPLPYRDNAWYFMWPAKRHDIGPRKYAEEALAAIEKNGVLIADYTLWRPLYFMQAVEQLRPDVQLVWEERLLWSGTVLHYIDSLPCNKAVYLATNMPPEYYQLADITKKYRVEPAGIVFKVARNCR